ncbi:MAG: hypothetical protein H8D46_01780 [FCB group bacterium]|nr:hypothetical protein [FCB group bacterium]
MRQINYLFLFILFTALSAQPDTTNVYCPIGTLYEPYTYSDYSIYLGDESSLITLSAEDWITVEFQLDYTDWGTDVILTGTPDDYDSGISRVYIGWMEWNYDTNQEELWQVYKFSIPVCNDFCCTDPIACNYNPCSTLDCGDCMYEPCGGCMDPEAFNYDPYDEYDDGSYVYCTPGDWNDDGSFDVLDVVSTVMVILSTIDWSEVEYCRADSNQDGQINIQDILVLIDVIMQNPLSPLNCFLEPDIGPCDGVCPRWFYNQETQECQVFYWGCCDGVVPFETIEACEAACE